MAGQEKGEMGSQSHNYCISDKSGINRNELIVSRNVKCLHISSYHYKTINRIKTSLVSGLKVTDLVNRYKIVQFKPLYCGIALIINLLFNLNRLNHKTLVVNLDSGYYITSSRFLTGHQSKHICKTGKRKF